MAHWTPNVCSPASSLCNDWVQANVNMTDLSCFLMQVVTIEISLFMCFYSSKCSFRGYKSTRSQWDSNNLTIVMGRLWTCLDKSLVSHSSVYARVFCHFKCRVADISLGDSQSGDKLQSDRMNPCLVCGHAQSEPVTRAYTHTHNRARANVYST